MPPDDRIRSHQDDALDPLAALRERARGGAVDALRGRLEHIAPEARPWAVALLVLLTCVVAIGAVGIVRSAGDGTGDDAAIDPLAELPRAATTAPAAPGIGPSPGAELVVHAAGAVQRPGLLRLPSGSRVGDLVDAAGGTTPEADRDRLNLAAPLADGERVYVPRVGEVEVPPLPDLADVQPGGGEAAGGAVIDINRATAAQLEELPGVGPSIAGAIVDHREANGPFRSVDDLLDVRGIGTARLEQLRDLVRVSG